MIIGTFTKQPAEVLDYAIDLSQWTTDSDFAKSQVTTADVGITVDSVSITNAGKRIIIWLSGGVSGEKYKIQVLFTTYAGRVKECEFFVKVKDY